MSIVTHEVEEQTQRLLFTVDEAARLVAISRAEIDRLIRRGQLESIKIGRLRRVTRGQLERFVAQLERGSAA